MSPENVFGSDYFYADYLGGKLRLRYLIDQEKGIDGETHYGRHLLLLELSDLPLKSGGRVTKYECVRMTGHTERMRFVSAVKWLRENVEIDAVADEALTWFANRVKAYHRDESLCNTQPWPVARAKPIIEYDRDTWPDFNEPSGRQAMHIHFCGGSAWQL